ncbi:MAG: hypothetical protein CL610_28695 [Anaerolineaceae bacterium]|nr:hypothetical protein [Anaerolineaceae bacterium]
MNKLIIFSLLTALLLPLVSVQAQPANASPVITLERTPCFGSCPVYTVTIYDDGTVVYNGGNFVEVTGEQTTTIEPEVVEQLVAGFEAAGYFEWADEYTEMTVTDLPTITTSVTRDGETKQITRYAGDSSAPLALPYLEQWIDLMGRTQQWTGVSADPSGILHGMESPVITLQRDPCFGFCPVYSVALYADGTVVFTGIANVATIGVQVMQVEPFMVTSIAEIAEIMGYFDWADSYQEQIVTDHATVTTSIQTDSRFKRIVRYDGDPNAPIGLVRIEDSIAQLVAPLVSADDGPVSMR